MAEALRSLFSTSFRTIDDVAAVELWNLLIPEEVDRWKNDK